MGEAAFSLQERYISTTCCSCGVAIAMPEDFRNQRQKDKKSFYCLNGHGQSYCESEADKVRKELAAKQGELEREKQRAEWEVRLRQKAEREKKKVERKLRRVEKGVCPECNRSFENLRRHMESKHYEASEEGSNAVAAAG